MLSRSFASLLIVFSLTSFAMGAGDPLTGTFKDEKVTLVIAPASDGGYKGTIEIAGEKFYFNAELAGKTLTGKFSRDGSSYSFTAAVDVNSITLKSSSNTFLLQRQGAQLPVDDPAQKGKDAGPAEAPPAFPSERLHYDEIENALKKARAFLYAQQKNGNWDLPARGKRPMPNARGEVNVMDIQNSSQWGGLSALATYALLASGENDQDPKMMAAIEWLKKANIIGTYGVAMRAQVWNAMPNVKKKEYIKNAKRDRDLLMACKRSDEEFRGRFHYEPNDTGYDHSASQYGVLGMWACNQVGAEVPGAFWKEVETAWIKDQDKSGGWNYGDDFSPRPAVSASMTAAGIATLFITGDMLHGDEGIDCRGNIPHKQIDAGIKWINGHYDTVFSGNWPFYTLFGIERIGLASGYKYLGSVDWYKHGAMRLVATQMEDGSWGTGVSDTCFAILFLVRGRNPVVMNKLQYEIEQFGDKVKEANWNQRPRDAANFTKWLSKQLERDLNWQIVNLNNPVEDLHDAPILYIAGNQPLVFTAAQEEKLRLFVQQGGLIVGNADCGHAGFVTTFKKLGAKLFPPYEFRELPANHLIYSALFDRKKWKGPVTVQGLSNDARELMILIPSGDPARLWQTGTYLGREVGHELMANIFMYVSEKRDLRFKGESWVVTPDAAIIPAKSIKLARLEYAGNWNPEPGGWKRLAAILRNESKIGLAADTVKLGDGTLAKGGYKVAHLTGSGKFKLTDGQRAELKTFVEGGGTLLLDAVGGNGEGATSLEAEIAAIAPGKLEILKPDHEIYAQLGIPADAIAFRPYAMKLELGHAKGPRLRAYSVNKRAAIIYSQEDLSVGLVGEPIDGIVGYTPQSATALMKSMVLYGANQ
jgi:hypothetical protein